MDDVDEENFEGYQEWIPEILEKEELRVLKKINKRKFDDIKIKKPIKIQDLFSSRFVWQLRDDCYTCIYAVCFFIGVVLIIVSIIIHINLSKRSTTDDTTDNEELEKGSLVVYCATLVPSYRKNIKEFINIPYASLPTHNYHFNKPGPLLSFTDCYKSYWIPVKSSQKKFDKARLTFYSSFPYRVCKQISKDKTSILGDDFCLTFNVKLPAEKEKSFFSFFKKNETKLPVIILLSGRTFLQNRPFPVGDSIVTRSNAIFITINFRLGIFGFSNFNSMKSPLNIGISDFFKAMEYIEYFITKINGNKSNVILLAEESGATTGLLNMMTRNKWNWYSKIWLIDGSAFVPEPPPRNLFYNLYSSPDILCHIYNEIDSIFDCLQNFTSHKLIYNTPNGWLRADKYFNNLPNLFEVRESIVEKIEHVILSPLEAIMKVQADISDIPTVIMSKIDYVPEFEKTSDKIKPLTKSELFTKTRLGLLTYQTSDSQVVVHKEINAAYDEYTKYVENRSVFNQNINEEIIPLGFEDVLRAIISDLRVTCPFTAVAKYLQTNGYIANSPIYRIIDGGNRYSNQAKESSISCDLNLFLQDESSDCISENKNLPNEYRNSLLNSFLEFINYGVIKDIQKMEYPLNSSMKDFEDTFTFIGRLGFRTPGVREIGTLQACNIWKKGSNELPMLKTSAKVN